MRLRSEWLTLFTVTTLAAGALFLHRGGGSAAPTASKRPDIAANGIDFTPVGSTHPLTDAHPVARAAKPHAKAASQRP